MMQAIPGGAAARPFRTLYNALDCEMFLRVAPELYLKRLVVGGFERVFELNRNFRNEGLSRSHNPEFTMLEFYAAYVDYRSLMDLTEELFVGLAREVRGTTVLTYQGQAVDLTPPWPRLRLIDSLWEVGGLTREQAHDFDFLKAECLRRGVPVKPGYGIGRLQLELFERLVEPGLVRPTFVMDFPKEVSPLAKCLPGEPDLVERFELFVAGRELANAFTELNDPDDQRERLAAQALRALRRRRGGDAHGRGLPRRDRARPAADRRRGDRHRPAGHALHRRAEHPRRDPLPAAAAGKGRSRSWARACARSCRCCCPGSPRRSCSSSRCRASPTRCSLRLLPLVAPGRAFEVLVGGRYLRSRRFPRLISAVTFISISGVTLGVMALIIVISVMTGFESDLKRKILGTNSHIVVVPQIGGAIEDYRGATARVRAVPGVTAAAPFILSQSMIGSRRGRAGRRAARHRAPRRGRGDRAGAHPRGREPRADLGREPGAAALPGIVRRRRAGPQPRPRPRERGAPDLAVRQHDPRGRRPGGAALRGRRRLQVGDVRVRLLARLHRPSRGAGALRHRGRRHRASRCGSRTSTARASWRRGSRRRSARPTGCGTGAR